MIAGDSTLITRLMRQAITALGVTCVAGPWLGAAAEVDSVFGQWWTAGFRSRTIVEPCGPSICARIVWAWDPRTTEIGQEVLSGLRADGHGGFTGGHAFNPEDGNTYSASLRLIDSDHLVVEACVLFMCREQVWLRVSSPPVTPYLGHQPRTPKTNGVEP